MSDPDGNRQLEEPVRRRQRARERWATEGERPLGRNLAMIGALGWLVVVPALGGLFAGRWLDRRADSGIFWTASLLFLGLALGCWLAWRRVMEER